MSYPARRDLSAASRNQRRRVRMSSLSIARAWVEFPVSFGAAEGAIVGIRVR